MAALGTADARKRQSRDGLRRVVDAFALRIRTSQMFGRSSRPEGFRQPLAGPGRAGAGRTWTQLPSTQGRDVPDLR